MCPKLLEKDENVGKEPISVNLVLTRECNYRCNFCFAKFGNSNLFNYDRILEIPCILKNMGTTKLTVEGGEPFLSFRILYSLLKKAKSCGITTMVISNGSLITFKTLSKIASYLDWIGLIIDSPNEQIEYSLGRGYGNHISHVKRVAKWAHELGIYLKLNAVVTKYNVNDNMVDLFLELKPKRVKFFKYLHIIGINDKFSSELEISKEEFYKFVERHQVLEEYGITIAAESNEDMQGSYVMIFPNGQFFNNNGGRYHYSVHTIFDDPECALRESMWDERKFLMRGGLYNWERKEAYVKGGI